MAPRALFVLGVLLCALVLVSSHVAAREEPTAALNAKEHKKAADAVLGENKHHLPPCRCCRYVGHHCVRCCHEGEKAPAEVKAVGKPQN